MTTWSFVAGHSQTKTQFHYTSLGQKISMDRALKQYEARLLLMTRPKTLLRTQLYRDENKSKIHFTMT